MFATSPKGWINQQIFFSWLDRMLQEKGRYYDGHASHLSIEGKIHFLCFNCTHLLQPLDVSVMSSLKLHFTKAFMAQNAGRVIIEADPLVGLVWPLGLTPSNLMSGFCKKWDLSP